MNTYNIDKMYENYSSEIEKMQKCIDELHQENQSLKKQLEKNQNPLKGIFAQVNDDTLLRDCGNMNAEINELKNQQKEFIKYLEDEKDRLARICNNLGEDKFDEANDILQKYKEIIGE